MKDKVVVAETLSKGVEIEAEAEDIDITKEVPCYGVGSALKYLIGNTEGFGRGSMCIGGIPH